MDAYNYDIKIVYNAVAKFIKWYNKNKYNEIN